MKSTFAKIGSILLVLVMSISVICSCSQKDGQSKGTVAPGTGMSIGDIPIDELAFEDGTFAPIPDMEGIETVDIDAEWAKLCEGMTPEEIVSVEQEFADLGLTRRDIVNLMNMGS